MHLFILLEEMICLDEDSERKYGVDIHALPCNVESCMFDAHYRSTLNVSCGNNAARYGLGIRYAIPPVVQPLVDALRPNALFR